MTLRVVTAPAVQPVSLSEMKEHLRIDTTDEDVLIEALIEAAASYAENYTQRALVGQELELLLPCFPEDSIIRLPRPPLASVEWIKYIDLDGQLQTVDPATYQIDAYSEPAEIKPEYLSWWPSDVRTYDFNPVQIRYIAGYAPIGSPLGDTAAGVPQGVKQWMKVRVAQLFEHREAIITGTIVAQIPRDFVDGLLDPFVIGLIR